MKKTIIITTMSAALILSACSSDKQRNVPYLEPQLSTEEQSELINRIDNMEAKLAAQENLENRPQAEIEEDEQDNTDSSEPEEESTEDNTNTTSSLEITSPQPGAKISKPADEALSFSGKVSNNATAITVKAKGEDYTDTYKLQGFSEGDTTFSYRARQDWGNLAPGENTYTFEASLSDGTSKETQITINYTES